MQAAEDEHDKRKLVSRYENHLVESGVPPKSRFGGQGATPRPDSEYAECNNK